MAYLATFRVKAKAKKLKPHLTAVSYLVEKDTQAKMRIEAEKLLRQDGMSTNDYFRADINQTTMPDEETPPVPKGDNTGEGVTTTHPSTKSPAPETGDAAKLVSGTDKPSLEDAADIASENAPWNAEGLIEEINHLKPGARLWFYDMPDKLYRSLPGIGSTALKEAFRSMAHFHAYETGDKEISPQLQAIFDFGSAAHCRILEPAQYAERFAIATDGIGTKASKAYKEWAAEQGDKTCLSYDVSQHIESMASSLLHAPKINYLLTAGESEVSVFYRDAETDLILKARVDHWHPEHEIAVDMKTTKSSEPADFAKTVRYDYRHQNSLYRLVTGCADLVFAGVEKQNPYNWSMARVPATINETTDLEMRRVLRKLAESIETGTYAGYDVDTIHEADVWPSDIKRLEELELELGE